MRLQWAWATKRGNDASRTLSPLPWAWFDADGLTEDEAGVLAFDVNATRAEMKAARKGRGG